MLLAQADADDDRGQGRADRRPAKKPNIVFIMGDDVGWFNIGAYHRGMMAGKTPNLDRLAAQGMLFTDYYAEAELHGGPGQLHHRPVADPHRADHRRPGRRHGRDARRRPRPSPRRSKSMGYATGQFGKNHLGDLNEFLPTVHGFDEFFGYLYHLDAMEDPAHPHLPAGAEGQGRPAEHDPLAGRPTGTTRPSSRAGARSASRRSRTPARSTPKRMETVDDEILDHTFKFIDKAKGDDKPFFVWLNPTRMHIVTHLSEKYEKMRTPENGWSILRGRAWPSSTTSSAR